MVLSRSRAQTQFVVLAPSALAPSRAATLSDQFSNLRSDKAWHEDLLAEMQRFRGGVYVSDGAVNPGDLIDGRHKSPVDEKSWHVLSLDASGRIVSCLRYLEERTAGGF